MSLFTQQKRGVEKASVRLVSAGSLIYVSSRCHMREA